MIHAVGDGRLDGRWRRWLPWVGLGLVLVLLCCAVPAGLAGTLIDRFPTWSQLTGPLGITERGPAPSPRPGDPAEVTAAWLRERITEQLHRQARALLSGDERAFLAPVEPSAPVVPRLKRQFRVLRDLRVTVWRPSVESDPYPIIGADPPQWGVPVSYHHCFVATECEITPVTVDTRWVDSGGPPRLVAIEPSPASRNGPRPWEISELRVIVGERTVVATTPGLRSRLASLLAEAERAAAVADRYAVDGTPPLRYRIFYAGAAEWKKWYGGDLPAWSAGYAMPVGGGEYELVVNAARMHQNHLDDLLRHELTHASSLPTAGYTDKSLWWLVEGLAEYAAAGGRSVGDYQNLPDVRRLLASGRWSGRLTEVEAAADGSEWEVGASYGIGFLAVRHLIDRFGEERLVDFFKAVVHERRPVTEASGQVFGVQWPILEDECVAYLRKVVS